jgi:hypothetical protein
MNDTLIEQEIQSKGLTEPRVTLAEIESVIHDEKYHVIPGTTTTICCLVLRNGFTVIGESSCVSEKNFDQAIGRKIAKDNAKDKIWALEGYLLKQKQYEQGRK